MVILRLFQFAFLVIVLPLPVVHARDYKFDGKISRPVLENYLSRSITMLDLLTGKGDVDDNVRMLRNTGAKFAGRTIYLWGGEGRSPQRLDTARQIVPKIHAADPDMILQACVFEIVSGGVEKLPVPDWASVTPVANEQPVATPKTVPVNTSGIQVNGHENTIEFHFHRNRRSHSPVMVYPIMRHEMVIVPSDGSAPVVFMDNAPPRIALMDKEVARAYAAHMLRLAQREGHR